MMGGPNKKAEYPIVLTDDMRPPVASRYPTSLAKHYRYDIRQA